MSAVADHLFINYATEDGTLAEWLTLRLTTLGYRVWCDRVKLLGGESYPRDIDVAIKQRTYRMLSLLSAHSLSKPNPLKERTLALSIARERKTDFVIPLNVDGLAPSQLDWMTSDLTFIPFSNGWGAGLAALVKKLESLGAPRTLTDPRGVVEQWLRSEEDRVTPAVEQLWTNLFPVRLPDVVFMHRTERDAVWPPTVPRFRENESTSWSFVESRDGGLTKAEGINWRKDSVQRAVPAASVATILLSHYLQELPRRWGLLRASSRDWYFPQGVVPGDVARFTNYGNRRGSVKVTATRKFWSGGHPEYSNYFLSVNLTGMLARLPEPVVRFRPRLHFTDLDGKPLEKRKLLNRRKALCKSWFNHQWLSRVIAIAWWLGDGADEVRLSPDDTPLVTLSLFPVRLSVPVGLDEDQQVVDDHESDDEGLVRDTEEPDDDGDESGPEEPEAE